MGSSRKGSQTRDSREIDHEKQLLASIRNEEGDALLEAVRLKNEFVLEQLRLAEQEDSDSHHSHDVWAQLLSHTDKRGQTALHYAISHGHRAWTFFLVKQGAPVDCGDKEGRAPLHLAVLSKEKVFLLPFLLRGAPNVNVVDREQRSPLHWAASFGNEKACQLLMNPPTVAEARSSAIADVNLQDIHGLTALHLAIFNGHHTIVHLLLRPPEASLCHPANPNRCDQQGRSPLHAALYRAVNDRFLTIIRYLVEEGADVDHVDHEGRSPLFYATLGRSYIPAVELIVDLGLNSFECDEKGRQAIHYAAYHGRYHLINVLGTMGLDIELPDQHGQVPLHACVAHLELLRHFMDSGVSLMVEDDHGHLPLHLALMGGHEESFFQLLAACPDFPMRSVDRFGRCLLHYAAWSDLHGVLLMLLDLTGPSFFSTVDHHQRTFVHVAAMRGHLSFLQRAYQILGDYLPAEQLVQLYQQPDKNGWSPLFYAAAKGTTACCQFLYDLQEDLATDVVDHQGRTWLHWAAAHGNLQTLQWMSELDEENLVRRDHQGALPLHVAATSGSTDAVEMLLELAAELTNWPESRWLTEEDSHKQTVLFYARNKKMLEFLINRGWDIPEEEGASLLHCVLQAEGIPLEERTSMVQYLMEVHRLSPTQADENGVTPLHLAAYAHNSSLLQGMLQRVPMKMAAGLRDPCGRDLLFYACAKGNINCMQYLCTRIEFPLDRRDHNGRSLLDTAAFLLHTPAVKFLLHQRQQRDQPQCFMKPANKGRTPLHAAVYAIGKRELTSDHSQLISVLLNAGFDINAEDHGGRSVLYRAVFWRNATLVSFLLQKGASVDSVDEKGRSLLMVASASKAVDCVKLLLASGAEVEQQDAQGQTAMDYWQKAYGASSSTPPFPSSPKLVKEDNELSDWVTFSEPDSPLRSPAREVDQSTMRETIRERDEAQARLAKLELEVEALKKRNSMLSDVIRENNEQEEKYLNQLQQYENAQRTHEQEIQSALDQKNKEDLTKWERMERQNKDQIEIIASLRQDLEAAQQRAEDASHLRATVRQYEERLEQLEAENDKRGEQINDLKFKIFYHITMHVKTEYHRMHPEAVRTSRVTDLYEQIRNDPLSDWEEKVNIYFFPKS